MQPNWFKTQDMSPGVGVRSLDRGPRPTWLMISPYFDGHHYTYLANIVDGAVARGYHVIVGTGDDEQGARTRAELSRRFGDAVDVVSARLPRLTRQLPGPLGLARNEVARLRFVKAVFDEACRRRPVDHVFLPHLDWTLFAMAVLGSPFRGVRYSGITMRQRFHLAACGVTVARDRLNPLKGWLFRRLLKDPTLDIVFTNDEVLPDVFTRTPLADKVVHIPDPSNLRPEIPRDEARRRLGLPRDACVVLAYGYLDARKGMAELFAWIAGGGKEGAHLVLAGQQGPEVRALLAGPEGRRLERDGRLLVHDHFVAEEEEPLYFGAADLVWLAYERFEMMSGVLVKAAQYRRTVVFREYGLIAHYSHRYGKPVDPAVRCGGLLAAAPAGLSVRTFEQDLGTRSMPDHSWSHALHLIYG